MTEDVKTLRAQLQQLEELHRSGTLTAEQYQDSKTRLERRVLDLVLAGQDVGAAAPAAAPTATAAAAAAVARPRPSGRLLAGLSVLVLVVAVAGYAWTGSPTLIDMPTSTAMAGNGAAGGGAEQQGGAPHTVTPDQINAMVEKLAARLKEQPDDVEGWGMLARSYSVLGRHNEAIAIYQKAIGMGGEDAPLLADYADSLAMTRNRQLAGEPMALVQRALKLDPDNTKALSLAGTEAFERKDYAGAVKHWERIITAGKANPELLQQVQSSVAEARQLAGMPASTAQPAAAPQQPPMMAAMAAQQAQQQAGGGNAQPAAAAGPGFVAGKVTLSAALAGKVGPEDSVFVFARAAEGPRMPLAVLRKQVKDLPFSFRLDDTMAMSPQMKLSGFPKVVVGARISKSGNPMAQPGDLQGLSAPTDLGQSDLKIEISQAVSQ